MAVIWARTILYGLRINTAGSEVGQRPQASYLGHIKSMLDEKILAGFYSARNDEKLCNCSTAKEEDKTCFWF